MEAQPVLVLVGGGRGNWPSVWSILAYGPSRVYVLPIEGDQRNTESLRRYLDDETQSKQMGNDLARGERKIANTILTPVSAGDAIGAQEACERIIERHDNEPVIINITQSPKMVAIGAAVAGIRCGRRAVSVIVRDTRSGTTDCACGDQPKEYVFSVTMDDYMAAYGRDINECPPTERLDLKEGKLSQAAEAIARNLGAFRPLIKSLRNAGARRCSFQYSTSDSPGARNLLKALQTFGLIKNWNEVGGEIEGSLANWSIYQNFLNGGWLEIYAGDCARRLTDPGTAKEVFSHVSVGLRSSDDSNAQEIDLACLDSAGMLLYASCKTSTSTDDLAQKLEEVVDRADLFGGAYCAKMFVTTLNRREITEFVSGYARRRRITIAAGDDLPHLGRSIQSAYDLGRKTAR